MADGKVLLKGTAFWVARFIDTAQTRAFPYLVTARHVIDKIRNLGLDSVLVRINLRATNKAIWVSTRIADWVFHEDGAAVDVAVLRMQIPAEADHLANPLTMAATHKSLTDEDIGIGSEVFLTGLFAHHFGEVRNIPIVRVGNIAAMPEEKVITGVGSMEAYLVESRSLGGISGSPVFVRPDRLRNVADNEWRVRDATFLLGLVHGHYDQAPANDVADKINVGIAIVVPIQRVLEVIAQPTIAAADLRDEKIALEQILPAMD